MYRAIAETGGTAGINLYTDFLGKAPVTLDTVCDHIFSFLELDPDGTHLSLGGDLDGCERLPEGFTGADSYEALAKRLEQRGLDEKTIRNVFWNNAMGVMDRAVRVHQK
jgi:microsomal dipeptidase-like Zn-dependent dipeptidase